ADSNQNETESELNGSELSRDENQQCETFAAVRHLGVDDADCLERNDVLKRELERAEIFALVKIKMQETATLDDARVDRQAHSVRRFETNIKLEWSKIAAVVRRERERCRDAHVLDDGDERSQLGFDVGADADRDLAAIEFGADRERLNPDWS